jgi:hypothetical protein
MAELPTVSTSWAEGHLFDLWMLVHFASGATGGFSNAYFELGMVTLYGLAIALMVLWELGEAAAGIGEALSNRLVDIVVGLAGVSLAVALTPLLGTTGAGLAFLGTFGAALIGMGFGIRAARRRKRTNTV